MTEEKMRTTIKKMLNLAMDERTPKEEADTAMKKATELMAKFDIDWASVQTVETIKTNMVEETSEFFYEGSGSRVHWESFLAMEIGIVFDCSVLRVGMKTQAAFLGHKKDVAECIYFFEYLQGAIAKKIRAKDKETKKEQNGYGGGLVDRIGERLQELYAKKEEIIPSECRDLVLVKKDEVKKFMKEKYPKITTSHYKGGDRSSFEQGRKDGDSISLNKAVGGGNESTGSIQ